uniref:Uncharacterized protein n=1 Tax=Falco tinnunculus TaxID=100819 RepID=A0A8C4V7K7_FALTI
LNDNIPLSHFCLAQILYPSGPKYTAEKRRWSLTCSELAPLAVQAHAAGQIRDTKIHRFVKERRRDR